MWRTVTIQHRSTMDTNLLQPSPAAHSLPYIRQTQKFINWYSGMCPTAWAILRSQRILLRAGSYIIHPVYQAQCCSSFIASMAQGNQIRRFDHHTIMQITMILHRSKESHRITKTHRTKAKPICSSNPICCNQAHLKILMSYKATTSVHYRFQNGRPHCEAELLFQPVH